jgi:hypothetical protein
MTRNQRRKLLAYAKKFVLRTYEHKELPGPTYMLWLETKEMAQKVVESNGSENEAQLFADSVKRLAPELDKLGL